MANLTEKQKRFVQKYKEDKAAWRSYVAQGWMPRWLYFVKFEGMSEEEAKALCAEAEDSQREKAGLFGAE